MKYKACVSVVLLTTHFLMTSQVAGLGLPDISEAFKSFYDRTRGATENDLAAEVTDEAKERVKRQDPGIGDESQLPHLVKCSRLPTKQYSDEINDRYMPTLGNGHLATTVYDHSLFLNGLYEGAGAESHRAAVPARVMSRIQIANEEVESRATRTYHLNAQEGYFMETIDCDFAYIEHKLYVHKYFLRVFVSDIFWRKKSGGFGGGKLLLQYPDFDGTDDITFGDSRPHHAHYHNTGQTKTAEQGNNRQTVHVFWMDPLDQLAIQGSDVEGNYTVLMAVDRQESSARSEFDEAMRVIEEQENGHYELFELHRKAWQETWARGRIELSGNNQLAKITTLAQFYLLSSMPSEHNVYLPAQHSDFAYGIGRTSLAKGKSGKDFQGHVMWDNEMYILPSMILFHPDLVKLALRYRSEMANGARDIAQAMGVGGYKYPVRSAFSGMEVSPGECPECENRKLYTSAAVSWAIRQYYSATRDRDYLISTDYNGCDITREIARFYAELTHYDPHTGRYHMGNMTGPDETYPNRKNNAFTLVAASLATHWARYMACECNRNERDEVPDEWIEQALYLDLPYDNVMRLHGQFSGFLEMGSPRINQADAILLTYPLNWNMSRDIMRHDLEYYEQVTNDMVPAMTWSFFTIGWKWVDERQLMQTYFLKSYQDYVMQPFKVWTEFTEGSESDQEIGNVNYLPGMGGFLQSLVYGFAGVRIRPHALEFHHPMPPPDCDMIKLVGLQYLGTNMTLEITDSYVYLYVNEVGDYQLVLRRNDTTYVEESLNPGGGITIERPEEGFFIYTNQQSGCEHPRDYIYMPWGYSPFVDGAADVRASVVTIMVASALVLARGWWAL